MFNFINQISESGIMNKIFNFGEVDNSSVSTMVSSACSSIENQALIAPHFFKIFILMLLIYFVIYTFSKEIWAKWFKKNESILISVIIFGTMFLWSIFGGGSDSVVRSGFSFSYIIHGVIIFISVGYLCYYLIRHFQAKRK